jgi:oligosaccharyltransferase complex subunit beta
MVVWILLLALSRAVVANSAFFFDQSNSVPVPNPRTLIVLPHMVQKSKYNTFFSTIKARGHAIEFKLCKDKSIKLTPDGQRRYENAIIFCSKSRSVGEVGQQAFNEFINKGGNLLVVFNDDFSDTWRKLALDLGLRIHPRSTKVIDHFNHDVATEDGDRTFVLSTNWLGSIFDSVPAPVLYKGQAMSTRKKSTFSFGLLTASDYGMSGNGKKTVGVESSGSDTILVGALETRNGARATFVGSSDMFSDEFFNRPVQRAHDGKR